MAHLQPTVRTFQIGDRGVSVEFTFGFHCFTDNKENGPLIVNPKTKEERYFCPTRYYLSKQLLDYIDRRFIESKVSTTLKSKRSAQARMAEGVRMEARKGQDAKAAWFTTAARQARLILNAF